MQRIRRAFAASKAEPAPSADDISSTDEKSTAHTTALDPSRNASKPEEELKAFEAMHENDPNLPSAFSAL
jgi:hypothetical protein